MGLKDDLAVGGHGDTVPISQGQSLVVIQHRVQVLDPDSIHRPVQHQPDVFTYKRHRKVCQSQKTLPLSSFPSPSLDVLEELPFLALRVLLHRVEKIPSVQSLVATSSRPNIWGAVIALGFILSSLWGSPQSVIAFIRIWIQQVFPAPLGPRVIIP